VGPETEADATIELRALRPRRGRRVLVAVGLVVAVMAPLIGLRLAFDWLLRDDERSVDALPEPPPINLDSEVTLSAVPSLSETQVPASTSPSASPSPSASLSPSESVSPSVPPSRNTTSGAPTPTEASPPASSTTPDRTQPPSLVASYRTLNNWGTGFIGQVMIVNQGNSSINGWTVTMTVREGVYLSFASWPTRGQQSGTTLTFRPGQGQANLNPGESVTFTFQVHSYHRRVSGPETCTINGTPCQ